MNPPLVSQEKIKSEKRMWRRGSGFFCLPDQDHPTTLPFELLYKIASYITESEERVGLAKSSCRMQMLNFIITYEMLNSVKLTTQQINHLYSWRAHDAFWASTEFFAMLIKYYTTSLKIPEIVYLSRLTHKLHRLVKSSECPENATHMQKAAIANGATWPEVENRDITQAHIDALCCPENQELIFDGQMTVADLLDNVTAANASACPQPL